jgi:hypothetical protein
MLALENSWREIVRDYSLLFFSHEIESEERIRTAAK